MESEIVSPSTNATVESTDGSQVELRTVIARTLQTIDTLVSDGQSTSERLVSIQSRLDSGPHDQKLVVSQVADALEELRSDIAKLRTDISRYIGAFRSGRLSDLDETAAPEDPPHLDAITGVCNREGAEHKLRLRMEQDRNVCVAVFIVERLPLINGRFGRAAGDTVLLTVSQHLEKTLPSYLFLSRWSGPAFMATFELSKASSDLESSIQRSAGTRLHQEIRTGDRAVLMPISCFTQTYRVTKDDSPEAIFQRLDAFVAARTMPLG